MALSAAVDGGRRAGASAGCRLGLEGEEASAASAGEGSPVRRSGALGARLHVEPRVRAAASGAALGGSLARLRGGGLRGERRLAA